MKKLIIYLLLFLPTISFAQNHVYSLKYDTVIITGPGNLRVDGKTYFKGNVSYKVGRAKVALELAYWAKADSLYQTLLGYTAADDANVIHNNITNTPEPKRINVNYINGAKSNTTGDSSQYRNIYVVGTSYTYGSPYGGLTKDSNDYVYKALNTFGGNIINLGVPGRNFQQVTVGDGSMYDQRNNMPAPITSRDIFLLEPWPNDIRKDSTIYTSAIFGTQLATFIDVLVSKGWDASQIVIGNPFYLNPSGVTNQGNIAYRHSQYASVTQSVTTTKGVKYYDYYPNLKAAINTGSILLYSDSLHATSAGHTFASNLIRPQMITWFGANSNYNQVESVLGSVLAIGKISAPTINSTVSGNFSELNVTKALYSTNNSNIGSNFIFGSNQSNGDVTNNTVKTGNLAAWPYIGNATKVSVIGYGNSSNLQQVYIGYTVGQLPSTDVILYTNTFGSTTGTERFHVFPNGNVSIGGTTDPGFKFSTAGLDNYTADFSSTYTSRSKTDKAYVDGKFSVAGTVTAVSSSTTDIAVATGTTMPVLTLNNVNGISKSFYTPTSPIQAQVNLKQPRVVGNKPSATSTTYLSTDSVTQALANLNSGILAVPVYTGSAGIAKTGNNFTADTATVLKSKAGALADYNILATRINLKQAKSISANPGATAVTIATGDSTNMALWKLQVQVNTKAATVTTTFGDFIYRGSTADTRLPGNITTTKQFITQTGNGTTSAAPALFDLFGSVNSWTGFNTFAGIINSASGTARGFYINNTLQATANNDNLINLDIGVVSGIIGGTALSGNMSIVNAGSSYTNGTYLNVTATAISGSGTGATFNVTVSGGVVTVVTASNSAGSGSGYALTDQYNISASQIGNTGSGLVFSPTSSSLVYSGVNTYSIRHSKPIIPISTNATSLGIPSLMYSNVYSTNGFFNKIQPNTGSILTFTAQNGSIVGSVGSTGNWLIPALAVTPTDAGYKLDIQGTGSAGIFRSTGSISIGGTVVIANLLNNTINPVTNNQTLILADFSPTFGTGGTALTPGAISSSNYTVSGTPTANGTFNGSQGATSGSGTGATFQAVFSGLTLTQFSVVLGGNGFAIGNTINFALNGVTIVYTIPSSGGLGVTGIKSYALRTSGDINLNNTLATSTNLTQVLVKDPTSLNISKFDLSSGMADIINIATDADYTITTSAQLVKLPLITANRAITIPSAATYAGKIIRIWNQNTSGTFGWAFAGATVKDAANNTLTTVINTSVYILESDGSVWVKEN